MPEGTKREDVPESLADYPERQEKVMVRFETKGGPVEVWYADITRGEGKRIMGEFEPMDMEGVTGRMVEPMLFADDDMEVA